MENLSLDDKVILEADALMNLVDRILRITWHNAVNECTVDTASLFEPCLETFSEIPQVDVLVNALLEFLSVKENEFAREDNESLGHVTVEMLVSVIKELRELSRI